MTVRFRSLRSGSSGNCLMLWTDRTRILVDCGIGSQYRLRDLLEEHLGHDPRIDAVVVTHAHRDHVCYPSLRVLRDYGVAVHCHEACLPQIRERHRPEACEGLVWKTFSTSPFCVNELVIEPFAVSHHPAYPTCAFKIREDPGARGLVIATDFNDYTGLLDRFVDADFIFVEANHDLELLRRFPNPMSAFHMENEKTAWLLSHALSQSASPPRAVMLGHLSAERNSQDLALERVSELLRRRNGPFPFELLAASRDRASKTITIPATSGGSG